jgi:hypothetical protein
MQKEKVEIFQSRVIYWVYEQHFCTAPALRYTLRNN